MRHGLSEKLPNLYSNDNEAFKMTEWSDERVLETSAQYSQLAMEHGDELMPRASEYVRRMLTRTAFEWGERTKERNLITGEVTELVDPRTQPLEVVGDGEH